MSNLGFWLNAQLAESTKIQFEIVERWPQKPIMTKLLLHLDYAQVNFILFLEFWCNMTNLGSIIGTGINNDYQLWTGSVPRDL